MIKLNQNIYINNLNMMLNIHHGNKEIMRIEMQQMNKDQVIHQLDLQKVD